MTRLQMRPGFTLIEMIAVIAVISITAGVVGIGVRRALESEHGNERMQQLESARMESMRRRRPVTVLVNSEGTVNFATLLPNGSMIADSALGGTRLGGLSNATD